MFRVQNKMCFNVQMLLAESNKNICVKFDWKIQSSNIEWYGSGDGEYTSSRQSYILLHLQNP